ncbi:MAG: hypothetical protein II799_03580, partial [Lachnospiraceae bacterium]|nr:hypothetical protein [Lachnospiraceae bacterium]
VAEFTIEKKSLTYEWGDLNFTYNGKEQIPSAAPVNLVNGDQIDLIISGGATAAGEHEATVEGMDGAMSANYELPEVRTQTYKIAKKVAELTWGETSFIYSGKDQIPTVSVTNLEQGDECELTVTGAATAVGTHKATVVKLSNDNYELPDEIEKEFTIAKADLTDEARVIIDDWTYNENPSVPKVEGNIEGANVTYEYKAVEDEDSAYSTTVPSLAGRYTVRAIIDGTAGYNGKPVTADFTIKKAASAMITYPTAVTGLIYDGKAQALVNPGSAFGGTVYYALGQDDVNAPDGDAFTDEIPLGTDTGTYYVWFKVVGDANHNDCECGGVDVTIIPVTRDALIEKTKEAEDYYDGVVKDVEDYADVAAPLKEAIDEAWTVADDDNVTDQQIGAALRKVVNALDRAIRKVNAPLYKIEEINQKRDRLVELLNTKGTDVVDGFYQSECDTVSVNYAVCNGKISRVMLDAEGIRDGYNYLTMNTGTSIILPDTYTISGNFADAKTAAKFIKSRGSIKCVLEPQKIKGVPTYELMLVNGSKKLVVSVIDVSLNAKVLRDVTLSVEVKRNTVSRNAVSANCISEYGYAENGGVITIATNPVFKDDSRGEKYDNGRFLAGVWMVGNTAITRGVIQTVSCKEATVHAKVNSDGTLSIGKAEGSGGGTVPISYVLNGKMSVRKDRVVSKSKIYKAKIKVK